MWPQVSNSSFSFFFTCCWRLQTISPWHSAIEHNNGGLSLRRPHITLGNGPVWYHQASRRRNLPVVLQREGKVWVLHTTGLTKVRLSPGLTSKSKSHRISLSYCGDFRINVKYSLYRTDHQHLATVRAVMIHCLYFTLWNNSDAFFSILFNIKSVKL